MNLSRTFTLLAFAFSSVSVSVSAIEIENEMKPVMKMYDTNDIMMHLNHNSKFSHLVKIRDEFVSWAEKYSKKYESIEHELERMLVWAENHGKLMKLLLSNMDMIYFGIYTYIPVHDCSFTTVTHL
jgi:hypothetical protein